MKYIIILLGIFANASASLFIKYASISPRSYPSINDPIGALKNYPFWAGIFFYGLAFILYGMALARFPLNIAHPVLTTGAIIVVSIFSILIFNESYTYLYLLGILFVIIGIILMFTSKF